MKKALLSVLLILGTLLLQPLSVKAGEWLPVKGGKPYGISGIALVAQQGDFFSFLVVHDNKRPDEGRLALVNIQGTKQPEYTPLQWPANVEMPIDLEALSVVPGVGPQTFMAATSNGRVYHLELNADNSLSILKIFDLPNLPPGTNIEGFGLQNIEGLLVAVYAHRGADGEPGIIYWGVLDLATYQISQLGSSPLAVPWPRGGARHVSDLKVNPVGVVFVSSDTDNGDDGPFQSAVYVAGVLGAGDRQIQFHPNPELTPLYRFDFRKIEALELVPGETGGLIVGSDDENMGGSVFHSW